MYYEEKVVGGVLCHRSTPDGEWEQFSLESLTIALNSARHCGAIEIERCALLEHKLEQVRKACA